MTNRIKHNAESCWLGQVEAGWAPAEKNGRTATCSNDWTGLCVITCDVCNEPIRRDQAYIFHHRLRVNVHISCPMTDVQGEDISSHTVGLYPALTQPPVSDTLEA